MAKKKIVENKIISKRFSEKTPFKTDMDLLNWYKSLYKSLDQLTTNSPVESSFKLITYGKMGQNIKNMLLRSGDKTRKFIQKLENKLNIQ